MIAVVDSYVAMTTDRPYRAALSVEEACRRLTQGIGTQFDPVVCGTFIKLLEEKRLDQVDNVVEMNQLREARQAARG
jgi:HD-GYP domain-containing protein (c-di-GMP phosphodiesterase class II)